MNRKENLKLSKIISEVVLFLLNNRLTVFDMHITQTESDEIIRVKTSKMDEPVKQLIKSKMERVREAEIEAYGWSLLGESDLEIAGLLIDSISFEESKEQTIITLYRRRA